jgi:arsenate reductase
VQPEIVEYLKSPPSERELREIITALGIAPRALLRASEEAFAVAGLDAEDVTDDDIIKAMLAAPILIERPIVVANGKVAIGRPPDNVLKIL